MIDKFIKINLLAISAALVVFCAGRAEAYRVSGVIEFTYQTFETKTGSTVTYDRTFNQRYSANLGGFLWDPRFLLFDAGVGYNIASHRNGQDIKSLDYNLHASFFPARKVSWDLFDRNSVQTVESTSNISGYGVTNNTYGGTLRLNLSSGKGFGNNNGNNFNNNLNNSNNRYGRSFRLPDMTFSYAHSDSESHDVSHPLHETMDDTRATLGYYYSNAFTLNADGGVQKYDNLLNHTAYDYTFANLTSLLQVSKNGTLKVNGHVTDREANGFALTSFVPVFKTQNYDATLEFNEPNGVKYISKYTYDDQKTENQELTRQHFDAIVKYRLDKDWQLRGGVNYDWADYELAGSLTVPAQRSTLRSGSLTAGASYFKRYTPEFLGPFALDSSYDFTMGQESLSSQTTGVSGSGWYYDNSFHLRLDTYQWKQDSIRLEFSRDSKRDSSPLENNQLSQNTVLSLSTTRIPLTNLHATATYATQNAGSAQSMMTVVQTSLIESKQFRRTLTYDAAADHNLFPFLTLSEGAVRAQGSSSTYTLLASIPTVSNFTTVDTKLYATLNFNYPISRFLLYRAQARDEYTRSENALVLTTETQSYEVRMNLDYRIRMIFVNFEYRWRQDNPQNSTQPSTEQRYYFVKVARPF